MTPDPSELYLLYADESNLEARSGDFFVYAGLAFPSATAAQLHSRVDQIRANRRVPQDYVLKFNPGPDSHNHQDFIALKQDVLGAAAEAGVWLLVYVILHDCVEDRDPDIARRFGINTVLYHFDCLLRLREVDSHGIVLIDRFSDRQLDGQVRDLKNVGIRGLPYTPEHPLERILGIHYSAIGQSPFASITDVAIGSLRFAINAHTGSQPDPRDSRFPMLRQLQPMIPSDVGGRVHDVGFAMRPREVRSARYRELYESLRLFLAEARIQLAPPR